MLRNIYGIWFWWYMAYSAFMLSMHYYLYYTNREASQELHKMYVQRVAKAYGDSALLAEPWVVIPRGLLVGVSLILAGKYIELSPVEWMLFCFVYVCIHLYEYDNFYLPGWELGEKIRFAKRWEELHRLLERVDSVDKKKFKDPG